MDNAIEKVRKLIALANSPNIHEAAAAAAKAQELMTRHQIDAAILAEESEEEDSEITENEISTKYETWRFILATYVAQANGGLALRMTRRGVHTIKIVAPANVVDNVRDLYLILEHEINRLRRAAQKDPANKYQAYATAFCRGAADEIGLRMVKASREAKKTLEAEASVSISAKAGLVRIDRQALALKSHMEGRKLGTARTPGIHSARGYRDGWNAGATVGLEQHRRLTA